MNYNELTNLVVSEEEALKNILNLLDEQYKDIMDKNIFKLEAMVDRFRECNKDIAEKELARRKFIGQNSMKEVVMNSNHDSLKKAYRSINKLLSLIKLQKDTNDLLIRQQLSFTVQMLNVINPRRENKTYNSYGNLSR